MTPETAVEHFWVQARTEGKLNRLESILGQSVDSTVPPPVWTTSADPATATADVNELLRSGTLSQAVAVSELQHAGQPPAQVGDLGIVLDGEGQPRALVRTAEVGTTSSHPDLPEVSGDVQVERLELLYRLSLIHI